jgi:hypothetical protein
MKNKNGLIPGGYVHTKIKSKTNDDSRTNVLILRE